MYRDLKATSYKLQVTSYRLQGLRYKLQAIFILFVANLVTREVTSYKLQVTSYKLLSGTRAAAQPAQRVLEARSRAGPGPRSLLIIYELAVN